MSWEELEGKTGTRRKIENPEYDKAVKEHSPLLEQEKENGPKVFEPVRMQPVISYGKFEGEFAVKGPDLIFHFWPYKYQEDVRSGRRPRTFPEGFQKILQVATGSVFGEHRVEVSEDPEMGAFFVRAFGFGDHDFHKKLAVDACTALHELLCGSKG